MMTERQRQVARAIGAFIRMRRTSLGWSQEHLARQAEVALQTVNRTETGARIADWDTLERLTEALSTDLTELLKAVSMPDEAGTGCFPHIGTDLSLPALVRPRQSRIRPRAPQMAVPRVA